jgi:hypothetical protein
MYENTQGGHQKCIQNSRKTWKEKEHLEEKDVE